MRNALLFFVVFVSTTRPSVGQDIIRFGSPYSAAGLGDLVDYRSSYAEAMGVTGIGIFNYSAPSVANPAFLGSINVTSAATSVLYRSTAREMANSGTSFANQLQLNNFQLLLPLDKNRVGMAISLMPLTERSYQTQKTNVQGVNSTALLFDLDERGEGNLNRLEAGFGAKIANEVYLGYAVGFVFGSLSREQIMDFYTSGIAPAQRVYVNSHTGFSHRFGFAARFVKQKDFGHRVMVGATLELPATIKVRRILDDYYTTSATITGSYPRISTDLGTVNTNLPFAAGLGITWLATREFTATGEVLMQNWSGFSYPDDASFIQYENRIRTGAGFQYAPSMRTSRAAWRILKYRAGLCFDSGHAIIMQQDLRTVALTSGISFPSPMSGSTIDVNFMYGQRGSLQPGMVRENIFSLRVSLNLSEFMFFKRYIQ